MLFLCFTAWFGRDLLLIVCNCQGWKANLISDLHIFCESCDFLCRSGIFLSSYMSIFGLSFCHRASFWIRHLFKIHFKTWNVPSRCPLVFYCLFVFSPQSLQFLIPFTNWKNISVLRCAVSWVWWHANHVDDLRYCSHSQPITHCHHSSDSILRLWYKCIFYSVCIIYWNKRF